MTWLFQLNGTPNSAVNTIPATGAVAAFSFKEARKQEGWTVTQSSDGTTRNASGDQITTGASGAGGMANNSAYFVIQSPTGGRQICFQRSNAGSNVNWRITISHSSGFVTGSPSATQAPTAADQQIRLGGGTEASPTFAAWWGADGTYRLHTGGDNASPYNWWYYATVTATGAHSAHGWYLNMARGTYTYLDTAPYVTEFSIAVVSGISVGYAMGSGYYKKGLTGEAHVAIFSAIPFGYGSSTQLVGVNPITGNDTAAPIWIGRGNGIAGGNTTNKGMIPIDTMKAVTLARVQFDFEDETAPAWVISTAYVADQLVSNGGNIYRCVTAGTSAGSGGPSGTGNAITDNTVTWAFVIPVARYTNLDSLLFRSPSGVVLS